MCEDNAPKTPSIPLRSVGHGSCGLCQGLSGVRVVQSSELFQGQRQMMIVHEGCVYRLICTRNNKLILQK